MIEVTDEMKAAFRAAQGQRAAELVSEGAPLGAHDILDRGLAAVLALVERDWNVQPRPKWPNVPRCPVVNDLCPGDSRGVLCLTSCGGS